MIDLGTLPSKTTSYGRGINSAGTIVVGESGGEGGLRAFRWSATTGMEDLGVLPGGTSSFASAVSTDGGVVAGTSETTANGSRDYRAFRWTPSTGLQSLGVLPGGLSSESRAMTPDGSLIVGTADSPNGGHAFMWTASLGVVDLNTYLPSVGIDLKGWTLAAAHGVSSDGKTITGYGNTCAGQTEGWIVHIGDSPSCRADFNGVGGVTIDDLFLYLNAWFTGHCSANFDATSAVSIDDLFLFLNAWFTGC